RHMHDDSDVRSRRLPNLGTKVAILAAIPFLAYGIFLVLAPITELHTTTGAVFDCGSALQPPRDPFPAGVCGKVNTQYLYEGIALMVAALGIAAGGALMFGFHQQEERA